MIFETERLVIRNYRPRDRPVFAAIGGNPAERVFHLSPLTRAEFDTFIDVQIVTIDQSGYGFAVVERKADGAVMGDVGIRPVPDHMPFSGEVDFEIDWQFDPAYFGKGTPLRQPGAGSTVVSGPWGSRKSSPIRRAQHGVDHGHEAHRHAPRSVAGPPPSQYAGGSSLATAGGLFRAPG